ncbi:MAG: hypothetical protein VB027_03040 [Gordonibacter sp.]|nr:hypothetical protein [Gordonibacter sp.]
MSPSCFLSASNQDARAAACILCPRRLVLVSVSLLVLLFLIWATMFGLPAHALADEVGIQGDVGSAEAVLENVAASARLTGSFDQQSYATGETAVVTFRALNDSVNAWSDVCLQAVLPQGATLVDSSASLSGMAARVEPGGMLELVLSVKMGEGSVSTAGKLVSTGDALPPGVVGALALGVAALAVLCCVLFARNRSLRAKAGQGISLFLAVALVVGLAPSFPSIAWGEEAGGVAGFTISGKAVCSSPSLAVEAQLVVGSVSIVDNASIAQVVTSDGQGISANAQSAVIRLVSDVPFADDLSKNDLVLGEQFEALSIYSVERLSDCEVEVLLDGDTGDAGGDGLIVFPNGSFTDASARGSALVAVESPVVVFDPEQGSYDAGTSVFTIPLSVENGRFVADASTAAFTFSNQALSAVGFAVDANDDHHAELQVKVVASTPQDQFEALGDVLDAKGEDELMVEGSLLVGHPVINLTSDLVEGPAVSLASAIYAAPRGLVSVTDVEDSAEGMVKVYGQVQLAVEDGTLDLQSMDQVTFPLFSEQVDGGFLGNETVELGELYDDGFSFSFFFNLPADAVEDLKASFSELGVEDAEGTLRENIEALVSCAQVRLADGVVLNAYGIGQDACDVGLVQGSLSQASVLGNPTDDAKTAFETLEFLANAIGGFAQGKGNISNGIGSLLGLIASFLNTTPEVTLTDIYNELKTMEGQMTVMQREIEGLAGKLDQIDKRAGYVANWAEIKHRMTTLDGYGGLYETLIQNIDKTDTGESYDDFNGKNKKLLGNYVRAMKKQENLTGTTSYAETMALGDLILGQGEDVVSEYYSWLESYYNWDPETFSAKSTYLGSLFTAYTYGYGSTMAYLNALNGIEGDPDDPFSGGDGPYSKNIESLKSQAERVTLKIYGTVELDDKGKPYLAKPSDYYQNTQALANGKIKNLVTNKVYDASTLLASNTYSNVAVDGFGKNVDEGAIHKFEFDNHGYINLGQWDQMQSNLKQVRLVKNFEGADSLYAELMALGVGVSSYAGRGNPQNVGDFNSDHLWRGWYWEERPSSLIAVSNASYSKTIDRTAIEHEREVKVDVFDLKTGGVTRNMLLSWHREVYKVSPPNWGYKHKLWPVRVL